MKRDDFTLSMLDELIIDNFAGGGGTSEGLEEAFGRPVDIAINHSETALAMHALNHPYTKHICESVWDVYPPDVTGGRPVGLVWLSPDCKHFSKAKGGTPVSKEIRGLAWVGLRWAATVKPRVIMLENVEEFQTWGPLLVDEEGKTRPDPKRKGQTFKSFVRQLEKLGYEVKWKELRACDNGAPTIRKRLFLVARRDGLPIVFPEATHGAPATPAVMAGMLAPYRTAAECIDFSLPAKSIFGRKKNLADNTMRRVAKGLFRHVLNSASPFIVGAGGPVYSGKPVAVDQPFGTMTTENHRAVVMPALAPFMTEHANASSQRTMPVTEPTRTLCAQVKGGHFSLVAPVLTPLRGTSENQLLGHSVQDPLSTVSAGGTHHALVGAELVAAHIQRDMGQSIGSAADTPLGTVTAGGGGKAALVSSHLVSIGYGEREGQAARAQDIRAPLGTVVASKKHAVVAAHLMHVTHHGERAGSTPNYPLPTITAAHRGEQALVSANLIDLGHGESTKAGAKRWSHGTRSMEVPLNTVTASGCPSAMVAAFFEQANGGFYQGEGRPAQAPMSTITASGTNQQLASAYLVKYYSQGGQTQGAADPMHTLPTKARMGLVQVHVHAGCLDDEQRAKAKLCAELLHKYLPEHFPEPAELVLMFHGGSWWALVDISLRMLVARELFRAQSFRDSYIITEIPNPAKLFKNGRQVPGDPRLIERIPLSITDQVRMCGNSVPPAMSKALALANFTHELPARRAA